MYILFNVYCSLYSKKEKNRSKYLFKFDFLLIFIISNSLNYNVHDNIMNKRENITIPWESRNGIVLDKSIINDTQEDTKNILNIILNALSAISGTK
jgi:hypothetical protein